MSIKIKICGINDAAAMKAACDAGAHYVGLVFYARSPRHVTFDQAKTLRALVPNHITAVGLYVDPSDEDVLKGKELGLRMIQLHGKETPDRVVAIKKLTGLPVMKAIDLQGEVDFKMVPAYEVVADQLLFDAKPPENMDALPGGNAMVFDWGLLHGKIFQKPWMLAGGLNASNVVEALRITAAPGIDVSSGVEDSPGKKNPDKIRELIKVVSNL
ncbi:MAG: phosphoribosylanthranilate isomerase [Alphaproteobacteria bacterium]